MSTHVIVCEGSDGALSHDQIKIGYIHDGVIRPKRSTVTVDEDGRADIKCPLRSCHLSVPVSAESAHQIAALLDSNAALLVPVLIPERFADSARKDWSAVKLQTLARIVTRMPKVRRMADE